MAAPSKALLAAFDRFMAAFPRRRPNPRAAALALFAKRVQGGEDPEALIGAAKRYAQECAALGTANDFIVHARTFLGPQQRYLDYLASAEGAPPSPDGPRPHALDFLRDKLNPGDFAVWIEPLVVTPGATFRIAARTQLALDRVRREWGRLIEARLHPVTWSVERKDP